jgi:hypothetical protein
MKSADHDSSPAHSENSHSLLVWKLTHWGDELGSIFYLKDTDFDFLLMAQISHVTEIHLEQSSSCVHLAFTHTYLTLQFDGSLRDKPSLPITAE